LRELTNTNKIQEFQRALNKKAKEEPKYRFYSLYDKTHRADILAEAYRRVKTNGGTSGVDGESCKDIEERGLEEYLAGLQLEMKEQRYEPQPVKRVYIPKANGKMRPLGIPVIRDRIVQTAFLMVLEPIFEADFAESSHGFRPKENAHKAIREIYKYLNWGCTEIYDVDLEKYFDTVDHRKLMKLVARRISDGQILKVIKQWLDCGYVEEGKHHQSKRGTPQGGVISPLLANIYLNPVDQVFKRSGIGAISKGSIHLVRYADDMLVLAQKNLEKGIALLHHYTDRLGLTVNKEKTRRIRMEEGKSVDFLGFRLHRVRNKKTGKRLNLVYPSPKSQQKCRDKVRTLVHHSIPLAMEDQVANVNRYLRGWAGYFRLGNAGKVLTGIAQFVNKRVRHVIQRRKGKSGYGWGGKIDSAYIYGELKLYHNYRVQWL
jgi:RNA-directed DNA polymerase